MDLAVTCKAGRRVFCLKRLSNHRYGLTAADDTLTQRLLEPATDGEPPGIEINFNGMKEKFYELTGIDPVKGIPSRDTLERHGMEDEASLVWR